MSSNFKITANFRREEFSRFVYENPNTSIFQTLEMAEVYKRSKGCYPLTLAVINEDTGEIMATLLAKILEEKPGFLGSFSRHSTIRGGPIFMDSKEGIPIFYDLVKETYTNRGNPLEDISLFDAVFAIV